MVLKARILKWFVVPSFSGPCFVRTLLQDPSVLGGPAQNDSYILAIVFILFSDSIIFALGLFLDFSSCHVTESKHSGKFLILTYR